jgi:hypothetical protein
VSMLSRILRSRIHQAHAPGGPSRRSIIRAGLLGAAALFRRAPSADASPGDGDPLPPPSSTLRADAEGYLRACRASHEAYSAIGDSPEANAMCDAATQEWGRAERRLARSIIVAAGPPSELVGDRGLRLSNRCLRAGRRLFVVVNRREILELDAGNAAEVGDLD